MSNKPKVIATLLRSVIELPLAVDVPGSVCRALKEEFPQFDFFAADTATGDVNITAGGDAWALSANQRPAMGTMTAWANGYARCLEATARASEPRNCWQPLDEGGLPQG